jgi:hypothetical protein
MPKLKANEVRIHYRWRVSTGPPCVAETSFRNAPFLAAGDTWDEAREKLIVALKRFAQDPPKPEIITLEDLRDTD